MTLTHLHPLSMYTNAFCVSCCSVEVMMSHLAPHLGSSMIKLSPPCLRLKSSAAVSAGVIFLH